MVSREEVFYEEQSRVTGGDGGLYEKNPARKAETLFL